jgi:hypothetical protein
MLTMPGPAWRRRRAALEVARAALLIALGALVAGSPIAPPVDKAKVAALVVVAEVEWLGAVHGLAADVAVYDLRAGCAWYESC